MVQRQQEIRSIAAGSTSYPVNVPVLSIRYFPTIDCKNPTQKISLVYASASSNAISTDPSTDPKYAIDSNQSTKWSPKQPYKGVYFDIDLGGQQSLQSLSTFFWSIDRPQEYHVDISQTGAFSGEQVRVVNETNALTGFYNVTGTSLERKDYFFNPLTGRYIRMTIDAYRTGTINESGQVNLYEFEVYSNTETKSCLDTSITGDVGINSNPSMADPLNDIRTRVTNFNQNIMQTIQEGSRFHGYKDSLSTPSLSHSLYNDKEFLTPIPISVVYPNRPDYMKILNSLNICNFVDNFGIKEVWVWSYHTSQVAPEESDMAMGIISKAYWNGTNKFDVNPSATYGDLSNSGQTPDLPVCNKTYVLFNFVYGPSYVNAIHDYLHQIENELAYANREMFWDMYTGKQYQFSGPRRCGHSHTPPNSTSDYGYSDQTYKSSDCEDWTPVNCTSLQESDACGGSRQTFNCSKWNCDERQYYIWLMQNLPGKNNTLMYNGQKLRNWWDFLGDFDAAIAGGKSLTEPLPTPTPTPITSNTITVSSIKMSQSPKGKNVTIATSVTVTNETNNLSVPSANVSLTITLPSGKANQYAGTTKSNGIITFNLNSKEKGTFAARVTSVSKIGYTYQLTNTTQSITVN